MIHNHAAIGIDPSLTGTGLVTVRYDTNDNHVVQTQLVTSKLIKPETVANRVLRLQTIVDRVDSQLIANLGVAYLNGTCTAVIETPAYAVGPASGKAHERSWLWGKIVDKIVGRGNRVLTATSQQRMMYATGTGRADKDKVLAAVIRRWSEYEIENNNIADGMVFASMAARLIGKPIEALPAAHLRAMDKIAA